MKNKLSSIQWNNLLLLSLFPSFTLFIFAPLEIMSGIWLDVWFDVTHMIGVVLLLFAVCFCVVSFGGMVCELVLPKALYFYQSLIVGVTLAFYIQGNFMKSDFGTLDGEAIDWSQYKGDSAVSVLIWIVLIAGTILWASRKKENFIKSSKVIIGVVLLTQLVTLITLAFTSDMIQVKDSAEYSAENQFTYAKEDNMIILVLDAYDSQVFQHILDNPEGVNYEEQFENFTYYPDTVGIYSRTFYAIPQMLTGSKYVKQSDFDEYVNNAYRESPFFDELQEKNYSINLYTNEGYPTEADVYSMIENYIPAGTNRMQVSSNSKMMEYWLKLIGIRYLPVPLKQYCWFYSGELHDIRDFDGHQEVFDVNTHNFSYDFDEMETTASQGTFHFYHVEGVHTPYTFDRYFEKTGKNEWGKDAMIEAGRGALVMVRQYLDRLKELGIYDDSVIIIMADHGGHWVEDEGDYLRRHNPLLLVKGKNEKHTFSISEKAISYEDLQGAYINLLDGMTGEGVFSVESKERQRIYINDTDFTEYVTTSHAFDYDAMRPTGVVYKK